MNVLDGIGSLLGLKSLKIRLLVLLVPVTLASLSAIAYYNFINTTELFTQSAENSLQILVESKNAALVEYIEASERIGFAIAATDIVQTYSELTNNRNLRGKNKENVDALGQRVGNLLYSIQEAHWGRYRHIYLINRSNRIVVSPKHGPTEIGKPSELTDLDMSKNPWAMAAFQKGKTMVSDYSVQQADGGSGQVLFFPIRDISNRVQTVLGIELQASHQLQILAQGLQLADTGKVFLVTDKGRLITSRGIENQPALDSATLGRIAQGGSWAGQRMNGLGREVIGAYHGHRQYPWILAAEIDREAVLGELYILQAILIGALVATLAAIVYLSLVYTKPVIASIRLTTEQLGKISLGEFGIDIPDIRRKDEIGELNQALQRLAFSLQMVAKKLRAAKALKKAS